MRAFTRTALQVLGAPALVLMAYGLDSWRLSEGVLLPRELLRPTVASVSGAVLPQIILVGAAFLLGWYLLVRNRLSLWVSLFYCVLGGYLLSYMPVLLVASSKGPMRELWRVLYYPCIRYLPLLPVQLMLQVSFAVLLVFGFSGMFKELKRPKFRKRRKVPPEQSACATEHI